MAGHDAAAPRCESAERDHRREAGSSVGRSRELCRRMVASNVFNGVIYACICFNTVVIAMNDFYVQRDSAHSLTTFLEVSDWAILGIFTVEMLLKMYAWGLGWKPSQSNQEESDGSWENEEDRQGYFASRWNTFDCLIVVASLATAPLRYLNSIDSSVGSLVRSVRAVRPLRALHSIEGAQDVLRTFPHAVPSMRDGIGLLVFVFVLYAIVGVNLFGVEGQFHGRCVVDGPNSHGTRGFLQKDKGFAVLCGDSAWSCGEGFRCSCRPEVYTNRSVEPRPWAFLDPETGDPGCKEAGASPRPWADAVERVPSCPDFGMTCFNNFAVAFLTCFKIVTLDNWSHVMWWAQDTLHPWARLYFLSLVFLVSFNIVNLYVAGISASYQSVREARLKRKRLRNVRKQQASSKHDSRPSSYKSNKDQDNEEADTQPLEDQEDVSSKVNMIHFFQPARKRLCRVSHACRRLITYPQIIDECGQRVDGYLLTLAAERELKVTFGPNMGQWQILPKNVVVFDENSLEPNLVWNGHSQDASHTELREKLLRHPRVARIESDEEGELEILKNDSAPWFDIAILLCIFANTVTMAFEQFEGAVVSISPGLQPTDHCCDSECAVRDSHNCPRGILLHSTESRAMLEISEITFCVIFSFELLLKVVAAEGVSAYLKDNFPYNLLDALIVVVSDAVLVASLFVNVNINVTVLRLLRIMRTFRLVSSFKRMEILFTKAVASFQSIVYVLFVLVFWHVIGALLAMQLFSCNFRDHSNCELIDGKCPTQCSDLIGDPPQCVYSHSQIYDQCPWTHNMNFNTFLDALVVLLFVTTGESWSEIMGLGMRTYSSIWPGLVFFVTFHIIGFYLLYNLFTGVILEAFELNDDQKQDVQLGLLRVAVLKEMKKMRVRQRENSEISGIASDGMQDDDEINLDALGLFFESAEIESIRQEGDRPILGGLLDPPTPNAEFPTRSKNIRGHVRALLLNVWFDRLILLTILTSTVMLAMSSPVQDYNMLDETAALYADYIFLSVFGLEFVLKILDQGLFWESNRAYFRSSWNLLDFAILLSQLLDTLKVTDLGLMRVLRMLRPLRLLNKIKSLQVLLLAMQACLVDVFNVLILWLFGFVIFAIIGVSIFSGKMQACNDEEFVGWPVNPLERLGSQIGWRENCIGNYYTSKNEDGDAYVSDELATYILKPRVWANPVDSVSELGFNFDNFATSFQTLFEVATFEKWTDVVFALQSITSVGQQPIPKISPLNVIYVHAWVVLSCFWLLQLVIGVLVDSINQKTRHSLMTPLQREWTQIERKMLKLKPMAPERKPKSGFQLKCWRFVNHPKFQQGIFAIIFVNICCLMTETYDMSESWSRTIQIMDIVFVALYSIEIGLKFVAYRLMIFADTWNVFDAFVVLLSVVEVTLDSSSGFTVVRMTRVLKVLRTIRLVRHASSLRLIILSLLRTLPHIMSALVLLLLTTFIFSVLGVQLFAGVRVGYGVHRHNNFNDPLQGLLLLIRVLTGEDWQTVMHDCGIAYPMCTTDSEAITILNDRNAKGDCGDPFLAYVFFDVFYTIGNSILLNLFIAVLLENFFTLQSNFVLKEEHFESFRKAWRDLDPRSTGKISVWRFRELVDKLHHDRNPMGSCVRGSETKLRAARLELIENSEGNDLRFQDVVGCLALHVIGSHGLQFAGVDLHAKIGNDGFREHLDGNTGRIDNSDGKKDVKFEDDDKILDRLIAEEIKKLDAAKIEHPGGDLERVMADLDALLSTVANDRFTSNMRAALEQLIIGHQQVPPVWPLERPKQR